MSAPIPSRAKLLLVGLGVCALLVAALRLLPRGPRAAGRTAQVVLREPPRPADLAPAAGTSGARSSVQPARATEAARPAPAEPSGPPATLLGRVTLDGRAPGPGARVGLRAGDIEPRWFPLDPEGRFRVEEVPTGTSVLAFALPPTEGRTVLVPERTVASLPGGRTELALDWRSRHVNLRVSGDPGGWNRARVHVLGAGLSAEVETDDAGRAGLILVEDGPVLLRARHPGGRTGEATLELDETSDLASAVIHLAEPGRS